MKLLMLLLPLLTMVLAVAVVLPPTRRNKGRTESATVSPTAATVESDCSTCPLSTLRVGQPACLVCIAGGRRLRRRLAELGLTPGTELTVLQNTGGPVMIAVRQSRLALGREMARKMDVTPLDLV